jgi:hypothetical protein
MSLRAINRRLVAPGASCAIKYPEMAKNSITPNRPPRPKVTRSEESAASSHQIVRRVAYHDADCGQRPQILQAIIDRRLRRHRLPEKLGRDARVRSYENRTLIHALVYKPAKAMHQRNATRLLMAL